MNYEDPFVILEALLFLIFLMIITREKKMKFRFIIIPEANIKIKLRDIPKYPIWRDFGYYLFTKQDNKIVILTPNNDQIILSNKENIKIEVKKNENISKL